MIEEVRREIIHDLQAAAGILGGREQHDLEELRNLSEQVIEDIAVHKDLELVSITVLIYSLYKIEPCLSKINRQKMVTELKAAVLALQQEQFGRYNFSIKKLYQLVRSCNAKVKEHLQDVMDAAKIKKGTSLLQHGLSLGQAAGLMGLSNWDLQVYAGKAHLLQDHKEVIPAKKRLQLALKLFKLS